MFHYLALAVYPAEELRDVGQRRQYAANCFGISETCSQNDIIPKRKEPAVNLWSIIQEMGYDRSQIEV
jgi:hypothetical protein